MRCPHCQAEPPRDPFVCTHCGERLLTYLDEPLGPGTGRQVDGSGVVTDARREPATARRESAGARATGRAAVDDRSWLARQIDPVPPTGQGQPAPGQP